MSYVTSTTVFYALLLALLGSSMGMRTGGLKASSAVEGALGQDFLAIAKRSLLQSYSCGSCTGTAISGTTPTVYSLNAACSTSSGRCLQAQWAASGGGGSVGCTANDVRLASLRSDASNPTCLNVPGRLVTLPLIAEVDVTAANRWDVGFYVSQSATAGTAGALTGSQCFDFQLPNNPLTALQNQDGDCCGDWTQDPNLLLKLDFTVPCTNFDAAGNLLIYYCASWRNQAAPGCPGFGLTSPTTAIIAPDTKSKCKCDSVVTNVRVIQPASATLSFRCGTCSSQAASAPTVTFVSSSPSTAPVPVIGTVSATGVTISGMDPAATYTFSVAAPANGYFDIGSGTQDAQTVTITDGVASPALVPICPVAGTPPAVSVTCSTSGGITGGGFVAGSCVVPPGPDGCPDTIASGGPSAIQGSFFVGSAQYTYSITTTGFYFGAAGQTLTQTTTVTFSRLDKCSPTVTASPTALTAIKPYTIGGFFTGSFTTCGGAACVPITGADVSLFAGTDVTALATATTTTTGAYSFPTLLDPRVDYAVKYGSSSILTRTAAAQDDCTGTPYRCPSGC